MQAFSGLTLMAVLLPARTVLASCSAPPIDVVWSYPADGDTNVPTNVDLWALPSVSEELVVSVNGQPAPALEYPFAFDLGELEPHTTYTLSYAFSGRYGDAHFERSFTTGDGPAAPEPSAAPGAVATSSRPRTALQHSAFCQSVVRAQNCFDTGQDTHFLFQPEGTAKAWLIREDREHGPAPQLWPAECGAPDFFSNSFSPPCVILSGIDASGALHPGQSACAPELSEPGSNIGNGPTLPPDAEPTMGELAAVESPVTDVAAPRAEVADVPSKRASGCSLGPSRGSRHGSPGVPLLLGTLLGLVAVRRLLPVRR